MAPLMSSYNGLLAPVSAGFSGWTCPYWLNGFSKIKLKHFLRFTCICSFPDSCDKCRFLLKVCSFWLFWWLLVMKLQISIQYVTFLLLSMWTAMPPKDMQLSKNKPSGHRTHGIIGQQLYMLCIHIQNVYECIEHTRTLSSYPGASKVCT